MPMKYDMGYKGISLICSKFTSCRNSMRKYSRGFPMFKILSHLVVVHACWVTSLNMGMGTFNTHLIPCSLVMPEKVLHKI